MLDCNPVAIPDTRVRYQNIEAAETVPAEFNELFGFCRFAGIGLARFDAHPVLSGILFNLDSGASVPMIAENYVGPRLREELDGCGPNSARATCDECSFACQRNHGLPQPRNDEWRVRRARASSPSERRPLGRRTVLLRAFQFAPCARDAIGHPEPSSSPRSIPLLQ